MVSNNRTSLSMQGPKPTNTKVATIGDYESVAEPPLLSKLPQNVKEKVQVEALTIQVEDGADGFVPAFLHIPVGFVKPAPKIHHRTAAILLSGAGGGVVGPSSIYLSLGAKLAAVGTGIPTLRLDYRYPARTRYCAMDLRAAMDHLQDGYGLDYFVLVGWSFGGVPVFAMAGSDDRVVGCAAIASQAADTDGIRRLAPTPILLLHGTADRTLGPHCSKQLYDAYGEQGTRRLHWFEGDDHALTKNAKTAEAMLLDFIVGCARLQVNEAEMASIASRDLVRDTDRRKLMEMGGDLRSPESVSDPDPRTNGINVLDVSDLSWNGRFNPNAADVKTQYSDSNQDKVAWTSDTVKSMFLKSSTANSSTGGSSKPAGAIVGGIVGGVAALVRSKSLYQARSGVPNLREKKCICIITICRETNPRSYLPGESQLCSRVTKPVANWMASGVIKKKSCFLSLKNTSKVGGHSK